MNVPKGMILESKIQNVVDFFHLWALAARKVATMKRRNKNPWD
ncbi:MAG: hypothetical protein ACJAU0_001395 [Flavobacteriales bacterium]|jgi:hypothetical protein